MTARSRWAPRRLTAPTARARAWGPSRRGNGSRWGGVCFGRRAASRAPRSPAGPLPMTTRSKRTTGVRASEVAAVELAGERHVRGRLPKALGEERAAVAVEEEGERGSPREHVPRPRIRHFDELRRLARAHCR